ncbi:MAG: GHKL domain-containing protein [Candidatus Latescibacteria bacterium]|nr:GHKL domain-containing protein [Candidatus Latescibacterota bacterium]
MTQSRGRRSFTALKKRLHNVTNELEHIRSALNASMAERERLEAVLRNVDSGVVLGQMAATIAHEIRNPLGGIAGFAALLERDLDIHDPRRRLVKRIIEGVSTLNDIVSNLLSYTRPIQLNRHTADLITLVDQVVTLFELRAEQQEHDIRVDRRYIEGALMCSIDTEQFQRVLLNLLDNAIHAMIDGGDLCVEVERDGCERAIIRISDSGSGIPAPSKARLFVSFVPTKEENTSLGLAIARRIVEAHNGTITVESEPGLGSLFIIRIPMGD